MAKPNAVSIAARASVAELDAFIRPEGVST
jgi:hypothetical protein